MIKDDAAVAIALGLCKERSLRMTRLRRKVLEWILRAQKPLSAYALVALFKEEGEVVTPTTVYRTLDFLEEYGLIHRLATQNAYVSCVMPGHKTCGQFLICNQCHVVMEMHSQEVANAIKSCALSKDFVEMGQMVEVWGLCHNCQKEA
jgi:Fur family zinc uptake transcriptional regulator